MGKKVRSKRKKSLSFYPDYCEKVRFCKQCGEAIRGRSSFCPQCRGEAKD